MGITLPQPGNVQFPEVPKGLMKRDRELYEYLQEEQRVTRAAVLGLFNNNFTVATAMNLGVSGTFAISSGGQIIVTSGIVITVTS